MVVTTGMANLLDIAQVFAAQKLAICVTCNSRLSVPIFLVDIGNICEKCFKANSKANKWPQLRNSKMEQLLTILKLPCKFYSEGCREVGALNQLADHEEICLYRWVDCPELCTWSGKITKLEDHYKHKHSSIILTDIYGKAILTLQYKEVTHKVYYLKFAGTRLFLELRKCPTGDFIYQICKIEDDETDENTSLHFILKHTSCNSTDQYSVKNFIKTKSLNNLLFPNFHGVQVHTSLLRTPHTDQDDKIYVKIMCESIIFLENVVLKIMESFDCTNCQKVMRPPIYMCEEGHNFCLYCRHLKCPICNQEVTTMRNQAVEKFLNKNVIFPCRFSCGKKMFTDKLEEHENKCSDLINVCPVEECLYMGRFHDLCHIHMKNEHPSFETVNAANIKGQLYLLKHDDPDKKKTSYLFFDGNIFQMTLNQNNITCQWSVTAMHISAENRGFMYIFKVGFTEPQGGFRKMYKSNVCFGDDDNGKTQADTLCIQCSELLVFKDKNNSSISYNCEISKYSRDPDECDE